MTQQYDDENEFVFYGQFANKKEVEQETWNKVMEITKNGNNR